MSHRNSFSFFPNRITLIGLFAFAFCLAHAQSLTVSVTNPTPMEDYAAKELCRYINALTGTLPRLSEKIATDEKISTDAFIIGIPGHNQLVDQLAGKVTAGPQGYTLKKTKYKGHNVIVVAANDEVGELYGVYGYLEDHMGMSFSFDGDLVTQKKSIKDLFATLENEETKTPAVAIRGFLPWTNFPQSATSYSWEDWKFILDQMAKMRLNFLHIHNYSGEEGHNEMFENFETDGKLSRVWMATARTGHAWGSYPGWDVNKYPFGSANLFDDYDFGADCALHNEGLDNNQVWRKGANLFQRVIAYAHTRGIKIGLGLDINLIPDFYQMNPDDPKVIAARVKQIQTDYPDLDYLLCFQSEGLSDPNAVSERKTWRTIFDGFYNGLKQPMPNLKLAVAGWGIRPEDVATLPPDVICAPISHYSDGFDNGSQFGNREYWGCPWLERDFNSSVYYYPYNMDISNTIKAWQERAPNMKGFYSLTWRITDAIKPKLWYMSRAPWDTRNDLKSSTILYEEFAKQQYGEKAAPLITPIINQNEPFASDFSECRWTPPFSLARTERGGYLFNILSFNHSPATSYTVQSNTQNATGQDGKTCVGYISSGSWLAFDNITLDPATKKIPFEISSVSDIGKIELRMDEPGGQRIGEVNVPNTKGWTNWTEVTMDIKPMSGTHRIYLLFQEKDPLPLAEAQLNKANEQIKVIDQAINITSNPGQIFRLNLLKSRIASERDHIILNLYAGKRGHDISDMAASWVSNFNSRVTDISSLGNVVSVQNRFIQNNYISLAWKQLNTYNTLPPENFEVKGTKTGARISWVCADSSYRGFDIYRDGKKITAAPLAAESRSFEDIAKGQHSYQVYVLFWGNDTSNESIRLSATGGDADKEPPQIIMISPPTSVYAGQPVWVKATLLDNRADDLLSATLFYRKTGTVSWNKLPMTRKIKTTFTAIIPADQITESGIEYYVSANDGNNQSTFPAENYLSLIREAGEKIAIKEPILKSDKLTLTWQSVSGANYYKVYRSQTPDFKTGPENRLTYVSADAPLNFTDNGKDLKGERLTGDWYYRITAVDKLGYESAPSNIVLMKY